MPTVSTGSGQLFVVSPPKFDRRRRRQHQVFTVEMDRIVLGANSGEPIDPQQAGQVGGTDIGRAPTPKLDGDGIGRVIRWCHANLVSNHVKVNEYFGGLAKQ